MIVEDYEKYEGLVRRYSDKSVMLIDNYGCLYSEAVDTLETKKEYYETDILIEN